MKRMIATFAVAFCMSYGACLGVFADEGQWTLLSNGDSLDGWIVKCRPEDRGKEPWTISKGVITAELPAGVQRNYIWLLTEKEYGDFELRMKVQTRADATGNSGVQVRSRYDDEAFWLDGPQVDINPAGPWRNGFIYDETREVKAWLWPDVGGPANAKPEHAPKGWNWRHATDASPDAWNEMVIICRGTKIETIVNGVRVADLDGAGLLDDEDHRRHDVGMEGRIGLQVHPGRQRFLVRFKDIQVKEIQP